MPSFLINPKMNPELRARVLRSLAGDAATRQRASSPLLPGRGLRRLALLACLLGLGALLLVSYRKSREEVETARHDLQERFIQVTQTYDAAARDRTHRVRGILLSAAQNDLPEIRPPEPFDGKAFDTWLSGDLLYLRGAMTDLQSPNSLQIATVESGIDAFFVCLKAPPKDAKEATLLRSLGSSGETLASAHAHPLAELFALEGFVDSAFSEELVTTEHMSKLRSLDGLLSKAKLEQKQATLSARLLLYVMDEPLLPGERSDFDGEGHHHVRVGLVELPNSRVLFRVRREVSPDWISEKRRLSLSRPLDSCKLAYDLRQDFAREVHSLRDAGATDRPVKTLAQPRVPAR